MYKIEFLPIAKKDIENIIYYISNNLKNTASSKKLRDLFINSIDNISAFPYGCPVYRPLKTLKNEYKRYKVKNFIIFYIINDTKNKITIARILYQKMDINKILE